MTLNRLKHKDIHDVTAAAATPSDPGTNAGNDRLAQEQAPACKAYDELEINALTENLFEVQAFVDKRLEAADCPIKIQMQIALAVEEIYVNIASYAYEPGTGTAVIRVTVAGDPAVASITFMDRGIPYDPLAKEDPDVTLSAEQRRIGGLGIFMTKQVMDEVEYEYKDGWNVFTMRKILTAPAPGRKGAPE